jgi:hypothetical protein
LIIARSRFKSWKEYRLCLCTPIRQRDALEGRDSTGSTPVRGI